MNVHCSGCGKEIPEEDALYRGQPAEVYFAATGNKYDWRNFAKCADCDYDDYRNTYGGM
jgi:hypothetical protein